MIIINSENNDKNELDKLSENCPEKLHFQFCYDENFDNYNLKWNWIMKINNNILQEYEFKKLSFLELAPVERIAYSDFVDYINENVNEFHSSILDFKIDLKKVPKYVNEIKVAITEIGNNYKFPSKILNFYQIRMYAFTEYHYYLWNEFHMNNSGLNCRLCGNQIFIGVFARTNSNNWKFYPRMTDILNDEF